MSTNALIAFKNEEGTYDINAINFDGYIEGVGKILKEHWNDPEKVKEICHANEIRSLGNDKDSTEFYTSFLGVLRKRKHVSFDKLLNEAGNFSYTYVFCDNMWSLLDDDRGILNPY